MRCLLLLVLAFAGAQPAFAQTSEPEYGNNKASGGYVNTRGFKMYYECYGKGEPLLIIHGNGGSIGNFAHQIPHFAKQYRVIVADSRAQGKSIDGSDSLSYEMMADDLNALLDTLKIQSCNIIGWSDGGVNALLLAIRHPEKVKKLAVSGANVSVDTSAIYPFSYNFLTTLYDSLRRAPSTPELKHQLKLMRVMAGAPIRVEQLNKIPFPTLVIGGDHDVILPQHTLFIARSIPNSYLWILPNSGHSTLINYKEQFNAVVSDFFNTPYRAIEGFDRFN